MRACVCLYVCVCMRAPVRMCVHITLHYKYISAGDEEDKNLESREYVVLSSRVHPGETNSSWMMEGKIFSTATLKLIIKTTALLEAQSYSVSDLV